MNKAITLIITIFFAIASLLIVDDLIGVWKEPGEYPFGSEVGFLYSSKQVYVAYHVAQLAAHTALVIAAFAKTKKLFWTLFIISILFMVYPIFSVNA